LDGEVSLEECAHAFWILLITFEDVGGTKGLAIDLKVSDEETLYEISE
jgi:hypothetical protein